MRILMFKVKSVCYDSTFYLADLYGRTLEALGHQVTYFNTDEESLLALERFRGVQFDAMLDFNSLLPNLDTDEGVLFLNEIDAPFYNYILDHPLYHNKQLKAGLDRYHVICLDEDHAAYIRRYYPHIRRVHVLPLCGLPFLTDSGAYPVSRLFQNSVLEQPDCRWQCAQAVQKSCDLVFTGTYSDPNRIYSQIRSMEKPLAGQLCRMIEILLGHPAYTQEQALLQLMREDEQLGAAHVPDYLYAAFMVDMYVKAYVREQVLEWILKTGRRISLYGGMWELWDTRYKQQLDIHEMVAFKDSPHILASAKLAINVMPWFKAGIHDRILTAMRSAAVSLTDDSRMLAKHLVPGEDLLVYHLEALEKLPDQVESYLTHPDLLEDIRWRGMQKAERYHTEQNRVHALEEIFLEDAG